MADRRESDRLPVRVRIRLQYPDLPTFIEKYSGNISKGGIFIYSKDPKPKGSLIRFEVLLKDGEPAVRGEGKVVWVRGPDPKAPERPTGMGLKFLRVDKKTSQVISQIIEHKTGMTPTPSAISLPRVESGLGRPLTSPAEEIAHAADSPAPKSLSESTEPKEKPSDITEDQAQKAEEPADKTDEPAKKAKDQAEEKEEPAEKSEEPVEKAEEPAGKAAEPVDKAEEPAEEAEKPAETDEQQEEQAEQVEKQQPDQQPSPNLTPSADGDLNEELQTLISQVTLDNIESLIEQKLEIGEIISKARAQFSLDQQTIETELETLEPQGFDLSSVLGSLGASVSSSPRIVVKPSVQIAQPEVSEESQTPNEISIELDPSPGESETELDEPAKDEPEEARADFESPQVELESPQIELESPQIELESPQIELESPQIELESPQIELESPQIELESPQIELESPQIEATELQTDQEASELEQVDLQLDHTDEKIDQEEPQLDSEDRDPDPKDQQPDQDEIQLVQEEPQLDQEEIQLDQDEPQLDQEELQLDQEEPQLDQEEIQLDQEELQLDQDVASHGEEDAEGDLDPSVEVQAGTESLSYDGEGEDSISLDRSVISRGPEADPWQADQWVGRSSEKTGTPSPQQPVDQESAGYEENEEESSDLLELGSEESDIDNILGGDDIVEDLLQKPEAPPQQSELSPDQSDLAPEQPASAPEHPELSPDKSHPFYIPSEDPNASGPLDVDITPSGGQGQISVDDSEEIEILDADELEEIEDDDDLDVSQGPAKSEADAALNEIFGGHQDEAPTLIDDDAEEDMPTTIHQGLLGVPSSDVPSQPPGFQPEEDPEEQTVIHTGPLPWMNDQEGSQSQQQFEQPQQQFEQPPQQFEQPQQQFEQPQQQFEQPQQQFEQPPQQFEQQQAEQPPQGSQPPSEPPNDDSTPAKKKKGFFRKLFGGN